MVSLAKGMFLNKSESKSHPRGDGPSKAQARINDNAYVLDLWTSKYNAFITFNVIDLSSFRAYSKSIARDPNEAESHPTNMAEEMRVFDDGPEVQVYHDGVLLSHARAREIQASIRLILAEFKMKRYKPLQYHEGPYWVKVIEVQDA